MKRFKIHSQSNPENPDFDPSRSSKVKSKVTIRENTYDFLSVGNSNLVDICNGLEVMTTLKLEKMKKITFYVITSPNDVITSKKLHRWKALIETFNMRYYMIWFVNKKK